MQPPSQEAQTKREQRERWIAWATTAVACLYCAWLGWHLWRSMVSFAAMFEGLGAELPVATRVLVDHGGWIYPACFGGLVAILIAKELMVRDKRVSTMLTCLVTIAAQFLAQWMTTIYYLPLFDLIGKLG